MAIKDDITVTAGSKTPVLDVETNTTIKHATTGKVYADEAEAETTSMTLKLAQQKRT
jgi:hypothetical protein